MHALALRGATIFGMRKFPWAKGMQVRTPCEATPDEMREAPEGAFCQSCNRVVHDLSQLTFAEAESLLREHGDANKKLCIELTIRSIDGSILLLDGYAQGPSPKRRLPLANVAALASAVALAACADAPPVVPELPTPQLHASPEVVAAPPPVAPIAPAPQSPISAAAAPEAPTEEPDPVPVPQVQPASKTPAVASPKAPKPPKGRKPGHEAMKGDMAF